MLVWVRFEFVIITIICSGISGVVKFYYVDIRFLIGYDVNIFIVLWKWFYFGCVNLIMYIIVNFFII